MRTTRGGVGAWAVVAMIMLQFASPVFGHTTLFTPNGGEQYEAGDLIEITWEVTIAHDLQDWDLWYSTVSADGPWVDLATDLPAGDPSEGSLHAFDWNAPAIDAPEAWVRVRMDNMLDTDYYDVSDAPFSIQTPNAVGCDFSANGICDVSDLNELLLQGPVAAGVAVTNGVNDEYDLNNDQTIDNSDVDIWLAEAATENGLGSPYKRGDVNLDGVTDGQDFIRWNENKFSTNLLWDHADLNGDGVTDGTDFIEWNQSKFTASSTVPEPHCVAGLGTLVCLILLRRIRAD